MDLYRLAKDVGAEDLSFTRAQLRKFAVILLEEYYTGLMHPEFGTAWREPHGELYKAYKKGLESK